MTTSYHKSSSSVRPYEANNTIHTTYNSGVGVICSHREREYNYEIRRFMSSVGDFHSTSNFLVTFLYGNGIFIYLCLRERENIYDSFGKKIQTRKGTTYNRLMDAGIERVIYCIL